MLGSKSNLHHLIGCIILGKVLINFSEPQFCFICSKSSFLIDGREDSLKSCCQCLVECLVHIGTRCRLVLFSLQVQRVLRTIPNGNADIVNRPVNTVGEGEDGMNWEGTVETYTLPRVKY